MFIMFIFSDLRKQHYHMFTLPPFDSCRKNLDILNGRPRGLNSFCLSLFKRMVHNYIDTVCTSETAKFCRIMNNFFDCMNVRSTTEHERKRNSMLAPYQNADDSRFDWLMNAFLSYLTSWKESFDLREGPFSDDDRGHMFLSIQTFTGLKITVNSVIALTRFLLSERFEFVLTERFCQDDVEEYFGYQ